MAVSVGYYSVVVRIESIDRRFPGGLRAYEESCPNQSFCMDAHVARVGFMAYNDAAAYAKYLCSHGLVGSRNPDENEVAVVREDKGHLAACNWLELGTIDGHAVGWLRGTDPESIVIPPIEHESRPTPKPISPEELERDYEFVCREGGVETRRHKETGELIHSAQLDLTVDPPGLLWRLWRRLTGR